MENGPSYGVRGNNEQEAAPEEVTVPEARERQDNPDDINKWAIAIQEGDGIDVGPEWWGRNVSSEVSIADQRRQFLEAYERDFPRGEDGGRRKREGV